MRHLIALRRLLAPCIGALLSFACIPQAFAQAPATEPVSFHRDVHPILQRKCQGCHQPAKANGKLVLTSYENLRKGGESGAVIEPGKPQESPLVEQIIGNPPLMPKNAPPLQPRDIELIQRWIAQGARDDTPPAARDPIDQDHPPVYRALPVISALAYAPGGDKLAISGYREVLLHKSDGSTAATPLARLVGQSHRIESIAYSPDGKTLAAVGGKPAVFGELQLWDTETSRLRHSEMLGYDVLLGASFAPDGKRLAFGSADKSARIIDVQSAKQLVRIDQHDDWCFGAAWSLDGQHLVTPGRDRHLKLMESASGSFIDNITSITPGVLGGPLYCVTRHPGKNEFLTGGDDGVPRLYQMLRTKGRQIGDDFNLLKNYEKVAGRITCAAFAPDGSKFVVGCLGGEARVYKFDDGAVLARLAGHQGGIFAVAFHPGGTEVATGGFDGQVRIYDAASGRLIRSFVPVPISSQVAAK